jgi:isoleucyl-tRNA synthetase
VVELGSFYLDIIKDRQYTGKRNGLPRRSAQTALYYVAEALVRWIAPLLSFTADEIWQHLPGKREASVFLATWFTGLPEIQDTPDPEALFWAQILETRALVNKALEEARHAGIIGSGLEAEVTLYCGEKILSLLEDLGEEQRFIWITSNALCMAEPNVDPMAVRVMVTRVLHEKCERCWHRRAEVNTVPAYPGLCQRCVDHVSDH